MKVNEIFFSIQGESSFAGLPCIFVRFTGCNLRCTYCDTTYAYEEGKEKPIKQILEEIYKYKKEYGCYLVELTGGEPLLQDDLKYLVKELLEDGFTILVETNGSIAIPSDWRVEDSRLRFIMDYKLPSSFENKKLKKEYEGVVIKNMMNLLANDELKFVVSDKKDFDKAVEVITVWHPKAKILFSPIFGKVEYKDLAEWVKDCKLNNAYPYQGVRMQIQLHKVIWDVKKRGV